MAGVKGKSGGHNRKTTAELKQSGGYRKHDHGKRADAVLPAAGSPTKPKGLTKRQAEVWDAVVKVMPAAALGEADTPMMVELCDWFGIYLKYKRVVTRDPKNRAALTDAVKAWTEFRRIAADYGLTPSSRAAIKVPANEAAEDNPFDSILSRMGGLN